MNYKVNKIISIIFNSLLLSFGMYFFLVQHSIASGGVTGISIIISKWFSFLTVGQWSLILNIILFIVAFVFMGESFGKKSILSATIVSLGIMFFERVFPDTILTNDVIINVLFGAGIVSYSLSRIFFNDASSGGTDIIAAVLNKYFSITLAKCLFAIDFLVVMMAVTEFGIEKALYAVMTVIIQSVGFNYFIQGLGRKIAITVISDYSEEINKMLLSKYDRGVTLYKSEGGYSHKKRDIILTIVPFRRFPSIRDDILDIDKNAFVFTHTISEVYGEGFTYNVFE
ncbi:YitT family protein [Anaerococcus porci]|uniref:YitT family protein n=1 Tax=Anaerococcus porci TaxID=2652269 RepID=UPI002A75789A|nr:YitT family protein [Anaerococcus porci]MDY3007227.1 YitT family protein [Anaerococcus porci]